MPKIVVGAIVAVIAIASLGGLYIANKSDEQPVTTSSLSGQEHETTTNNPSHDNASDPTSGEVLSGEVTVNIRDFAYQDQTIKIKKGTKVTWVNQDTTRHDITPDTDSKDFSASELLDQGESYTVTFNILGTFSYHCSPHPHMTGSVEVVE